VYSVYVFNVYHQYSTNCWPNVGYVTLNGVVVWSGSTCGTFSNPRGVNTLLINQFICSVQQSRLFDTHNSTDNARHLSDYLHQVNHGSVIVGVSADEPSSQLSSALSTLRQFGVEVADVQFRGSFAFIAQKDYPVKTVLSKALTETESERSPARVNAVITGIQLQCCMIDDIL